MDISTVELLEFDIIRKECASLCLSNAGREVMESQEIESDGDVLDALLSRVCDMHTIIRRADGIPVTSFPDVSFLPILEKEGRSLEGEELASLGIFLRSGAKLREFILSYHDSLPQLSGLLRETLSELPSLSGVVKEIFSEITEDGSVRNDHPALKKIRSRLRSLHGDLTRISGSIMRTDSSLWQMEGPVLREGRTVLPLKADYRGRIQGIIHETSSSGNTIYIEPFDMVELNNERAVQESAYRNVIHTIVREISDKVRQYYGDIRLFIEAVAYTDTLIARARYGEMHGCSRARRSREDVRLEEARHPHLGSAAVPITVRLAGDTRVMIITGPNAGGKTVTLKTIGLLALMNQFGLEIPAAEGSGLPIFEDIYADIGDDQSISASLSTFSGHMKRIAAILRYCTDRSLVLLDELGAGTDPAEGSALGMSILDELMALGATVVVTTHHGVMKQFAYTRRGAMNASLSFDQGTLQPTYRVIEGLPGESHALDIAVKSGIGESIISSARDFLEDRKSDISNAVEELEKHRRDILNREKEILEREKELTEDRRKLDLKNLSLRQKEAELKKREVGENNRFIRESRKELENLVRELKEGNISREKTKKTKTLIEDMEIKAAREEAVLEEIQSWNRVETDYTPEPGDDVRVAGKEGTVLRKEKNGKWLVRVGSMKVAMDVYELEQIKKSGRKKDNVSVVYSLPLEGAPAAYDLDLRGMRLEEALLLLEKQIDGAVLTGLSIFNVIHGTGEGILRKGVQDYLSQCPAVEDFSFSHPEEGGFGKTIVRMKQT